MTVKALVGLPQLNVLAAAIRSEHRCAFTTIGWSG